MAYITQRNNHSSTNNIYSLIYGRPCSSCCRAATVAPAAASDPRHMLRDVHPDNFEGLAVAAEVIALGKIHRLPPLHRLHFE